MRMGRRKVSEDWICEDHLSSSDRKLSINFTHRGIFPELEKLFFRRLARMGFPISIEVDGLPIHEKSWEELSHFSALPKENDESLL